MEFDLTIGSSLVVKRPEHDIADQLAKTLDAGE